MDPSNLCEYHVPHELVCSPMTADAPTEELVALLQHGSRLVKTLSPETGDPQMRLERYLLRLVRSRLALSLSVEADAARCKQYERCDMEDSISALLQQLSVDYPQSAAALVLRTEFLTYVVADTPHRASLLMSCFTTAGRTQSKRPVSCSRPRAKHVTTTLNLSSMRGLLSSIERARRRISGKL